MKISERLVVAAEVFYRLAPVAPRAELTTDDQLVVAFRLFRYWHLRSLGETAKRAKWVSATDAEILKSGWYDAVFSTLDRRDRDPANQVTERFERRKLWDEQRMTARWFAKEAPRIGWIPANL